MDTPARTEADYLRLTVEGWDEAHVYGYTREGVLVRAQYVTSETDWSYLRPMLAKGAQLNLVHPHREDGGKLTAELFIFEPDYLVDISAVAHSFESYAENATVHLLRRLQPAASSEAIVLGHLASQMLDEAVHGTDLQQSYAESVRTFFRTHGLSIAAADIGPQFHQAAQAQRDNIARAIRETLPQSVPTFRRDEAMLEPSFFSEMLGLQGRMDLLTADFRTVLEQKAGRGAFIAGDQDAETPVGRTEHRVQLLLYMLLLRYNHAERVGQDGHALHAFLLYSRYANSLLGLQFEKALTFRAVRVRNLIAYAEQRCADADGWRFLETLTPEMVNERGCQGRLWTNYQRLQIAALLRPLQTASPLERAYCLRLLRFVSLEHKLSKLGTPRQEGSGFASKWLYTLEEKLQAGTIYDRLTLVSPNTTTTGRVEEVRLQFGRKQDDTSNFRTGDIVVLYAYEADMEPDVRKAIVFRATIASITATMLTLRLRAAQTDARVLLRERQKLWAVEHDFFESSYNAQYQGLYALLTAPQARRDLLLLQRQPSINMQLTLRGDYGAFNELALRARQARDLFLIIGPPGTGKTSFGLMCCLQEELLSADARVLLLAFTNRAVDEICAKLTAADIDFIRVGNRLTCAEAYHPYLMEEVLAMCPTADALRHRIREARVVVGTAASVAAHTGLFSLRGFSLAIIDEASQLLEPHLMGLLSMQTDGKAAIQRFILIGDHKQLPAVVAQEEKDSAVTEKELRAIGLTDCRRSLFERLLERYGQDPHVTYLLTRQGRMHREIAAFPNKTFYGGLLCDALERQRAPLPTSDEGNTDGLTALLRSRRIAFVASPSQTNEAAPADKVNLAEARMIAALVAKVQEMEGEAFDADHSVGIIVPYRNQIATIRSALLRYNRAGLEDVTIDTVERYQGSQRRTIIYGFTVRREQQLDFLTGNTFTDIDGTLVDRKLNVAMTRAEEHLILMGNPKVLGCDVVFNRMIQFFRERQCYIDVAEEDFVGGRFRLPEKKDDY